MKTRSLLERLAGLLDREASALRAERASILALLGKLRARERELQRELARFPAEDEREGMESKLEVIRAQRRKGVEHLLELRRGRNGDEDGAPPVSDDR